MSHSRLLLITLSVTLVSGPIKGAAAPSGAARPLVLLVLQDLSGSVSENAIPPVVAQDLDPVLAYLRSHGGEIAFGVVNSGHNQLLRIRYDAPASGAVKGRQSSRNLFQQLRDRAEAEKASAAAGPALAAAQEELQRSEQEFKEGVQRLLRARPSSSTNLIAGLDRAAVYFSEDRPYENALEVFLAVTDGEETTHRGAAYRFELKPSILVLMVNNSATRLGIFTPLKDRVKVYESPKSAIATILKTAQGGGK
jgi:hypothetical protein